MKKLLVLPMLFAAVNAQAAEFNVDKAKSLIKFQAVQNGAPVMGEFKDYDAAISFDPEKLDTSKAAVTIKTASVASSYEEMASSLKGGDWFDVKTYPAAKFETTKFTKLADGSYEALGNLTIRNKTKPVPLKFKLKEFDAKHAVVDAETTISRNAFGVGQGEWKSTSAVKDEVKVTIHLEALAK